MPKSSAGKVRAANTKKRVPSLTPNVIVGKGIRAPRTFVESCVAMVVRELSRTGTLTARALKTLSSAEEMSVVFVSRDEIRRLNREFRGKDKPTDVLSFDPLEDGSLGELVISLDVIRVQAREHDLSLNDELGYMLLHGVLHLLGYDHEVSTSGARRMFAIQDRIFDKYKGRW